MAANQGRRASPSPSAQQRRPCTPQSVLSTGNPFDTPTSQAIPLHLFEPGRRPDQTDGPTDPEDCARTRPEPAWRRFLNKVHVVLVGRQDKSILTYLTFCVTLIGIPVGIGAFLVGMSSLFGWPQLPVGSFFAHFAGQRH